MKQTLLLFILIIIHNSTFAQMSSKDIAEKTDKSIVFIETYDMYGNYLKQGSGVVLTNDGKIVTNYHVYEGGSYMIIKHDKKSYYSQQILNYDKSRDFLIFTIDNNPFPPLKIGNSDSLKKGEIVYAIGSPRGYENSFTQGIISALRAARFNNSSYQNYIQHDAAISPGSSGGALVNENAELIGINVMQDIAGQNINFAIPINEIVNTIRGLKGNNYFTVPKNDDLFDKTPKGKTEPKYEFKKEESTWLPSTPNYNPYGEGNGQICMYTSCSNCIMDIYIDKKWIGKTNTYFNSVPVCGQQGTINLIVKVGKHEVYAKDIFGNIWNSYINVPVGECIIVHLGYIQNTNPNNVLPSPTFPNQGFILDPNLPPPPIPKPNYTPKPFLR